MSELRRTTLDSGLRIVTEPTAGVRSVAFGIWVGTGSRYETDAQAGTAHFIEHLLFKGTPTYSARDIAERFDGLGGEVNAATGRDYTVFYTRVLDEHLDQAAPVLADMLQRPGFYELDQEREVVLEEIAMYEDDPQDKVHELIGAAVFPAQPLGRPVIGTADVIGTVGLGDLQSYFRSHYTTGNTVIAASGNIDHDHIVALATALFGDMPQGPGETGYAPAAPGAPSLVLEERPTEQYHLAFGAPGISRDDPRRHAQSVLDTVLGGSMSSRLFQEIREKRGLAYSVGSYTAGYADAGQVGLFLGTRGDNVAASCAIIRDELTRLAGEPIPADELERAKEHLKGRLVLSLESATMRMNRIGRATVTGSELLSIEEHLQRLAAVSADDVRALAAQYWTPERFSLAAIGADGDLLRGAWETFAPGVAGS